MKITLYSYQKPKAVEKLKKDGVLRLTKKDRWRTTPYQFQMKGFHQAYKFIADEMNDRVEKRKFEDTSCPIWAWYIYCGEPAPTKDLDDHHKGQIRLKIEIDDSRVLLSDFDMFCYIAGHGYYFNVGKKQKRLYEGKYGRPAKFYYPNWRLMFKLHRKKGNDYAFSYKQESVQGTFWELFLEDVTEYKLIK